MTATGLAVPDGTNLAIQTLREQIAPDATDAELAYFGQVCRRLDLSPFADQIVLIGRWDNRLKRKVHRHQITVAGRRTLAQRTGLLAGIDGPVWCGPRRFDAAGKKLPLEWTELWDDDDNFPYCARVLVYVKGWERPANGTAKWSEFAQYDSNDKLGVVWARMPSHMLGKVAESLALRRAFPDVIPADIADRADHVEDDLADTIADLGGAPPEPAAVGVATSPPPGGPPTPPPAESPGRPAATRPPPQAAPSFRRPPARDQNPPADYYDNLPEARGYDDDIQPASYDDPDDPGRPFR